MNGNFTDNSGFEPISTQRASEAIYEQIRQRIISGVFLPGDKLPSEKELIDMFQRSRPTVREALRMLEKAGLVKTNAGSKGSVVMEPSVEFTAEPLSTHMSLSRISKADLFEYRWINDIATVGWAAERRTDGELDELRGIIERMGFELADPDAFTECSNDFLDTVARCTHNDMIVLMNSITKRADPQAFGDIHSRNKTWLVNVFELYQSLVKAIELKDAGRARALQSAHVRRMLERERQAT